MRRMYSESELRAFIKKYIRENGDDVVASLVGKDISVEGITSKGIANTGGLANIGDVAISGDLIVQGENKGNISATGKITGSEIIENMSSDYSFRLQPTNIHENISVTPIYAGAVKNGNKLTLVLFMTLRRTGELPSGYFLDNFCGFRLPNSLSDKLVAYSVSPFSNALDNKSIPLFSSYNASTNKLCVLTKSTYGGRLYTPLTIYGLDALTIDTNYNFRYECTFLLSENLAPQE